MEALRPSADVLAVLGIYRIRQLMTSIIGGRRYQVLFSEVKPGAFKDRLVEVLHNQGSEAAFGNGAALEGAMAR